MTDEQAHAERLALLEGVHSALRNARILIEQSHQVTIEARALMDAHPLKGHYSTLKGDEGGS